MSAETERAAEPVEGTERRRRGPARAVVSAIRPQEWVKNGFVLAPLLFSGRLDENDVVAKAVFAALAFCFVASAGYLVNDWRDRELDRQHPRKRYRAIAAGELAATPALVLAAVLEVGGLALALLVGWKVLALVVGYIVLSFTYSAVLKTLVIVDVLAIVAGFLLRVVAGATAVEATASEWLIVCTGALAMFLGFTKRRQEAATEEHLHLASRPVLEHYSLPFLDQMVAMVTTGTVLSYVLYAVNSPVIGSRMLPTAVPVLYGVFRYLYLMYDRNDQRSTAEIVRRDPGIIAAGVVWVALAIGLLYT